MLKTIRHIEYLLRNNDCVVIPDFGAFIARSVNSHEEDGVLTPPARKVGFNGAVSHSDGMLAHSIMRKEHVGYDRAVELISADVAAMKSQLAADGELFFGGIGMFRLSAEGQPVFTPSAEVEMAALSCWGLPDVDLKPLADGKARNAMVEESPVSPTRQAGVIYLPLSRKLLRIAASIVVLAVLALTLTTPVAVDRLPDYAGLTTVRTVSARKASQTVRPSDSLAAVGKMEDEGTTNSGLMVNQEDSEVLTEKGKVQYHVVVASFSTYRQAESYIASQRNEAMSIIDEKGASSIYRVAIASEPTLEDSRNVIRNNGLADKYPGVWVCKK